MRISLFWRTFLLIAPVIALSTLVTLQLLRQFDRSPPEQQLAWEIASIVNLTRTALVNTPAERRQLLLRELAHEEGVRVIPLESGDTIESLSVSEPEEASLAVAVEARLQAMLGPTTRLAGRVDEQPALWVSFDIDGDPYWLMLNRERFNRQLGPNWPLIALMGLAASMLASLLVSLPVNRPLSRLAGAIEHLSRGREAGSLDEEGPTEIAEVNRRFNRLAQDLAELDSDRTVALAGVSHDIRTPLARLRLEIEMTGLPEAERDSMNEDIMRIDQIVGKFLEYGRAGHAGSASIPGREADRQQVDVAEAIAEIEASYRSSSASGQLRLAASVLPADAQWRGERIDLLRVLGNLIENACRYGQTPGSNRADVDLAVEVDKTGLQLRCRDHGPGVPVDQIERLLRPFARLDTQRSPDGGAGLGLAIVDRIAQRYDGSCRLSAAEGGGLQIEVRLRHAW